ncbi:6-phospho-beta-glucosidase [Cellulomonas sp. ATA003]|uniref:family 4 glycosyl hydrolase n=1 Tax=Cellulomonas sp. ATA003 TaxID=3073064 RepID=UPI002873C186|nr:6-phospho-beta-glucosidase [Cellulomonas sp. ATA003]WNB86642.1 6-phospho-beta-glucosidase [Cellulomonas sp. ATA003]
MKLTIVGGGGFRVPQVWSAVGAPDAPVRIDEVALHDVDTERLGVIAAVVRRLADGVGRPPRLTVTTDLDEALRGADFVFAAVRVGGTAGRILDERTALALGVLGQETIGPGGQAYALRTVPFMVALARRIAAVAPDAWVINFTNPAGMVTEAMRGVLGDRVIGICDTPIGLMRRAARSVARLDGGAAGGAGRAGAVPAAGEFDYVGLNHLGWLRALRVDGVDRLPDLLADDAALEGIEEARLMGADWVRLLGALPNEYLYYYYFTREATARIAGSVTRGEFLADQQAGFYADAAAPGADPLAVWHRYHHEREATYMAESRPEGEGGERHAEDVEGGYHRVALDLMAALTTGRPATMILDVRNGDLVPQLPAEAVVEVGCVVDGGGVHPWPVAPLDGHMAGLMAQTKAAEQLTIAAALEASAELAWKAFAVHPLVDSVAVGRSLLDHYTQAFPELGRALR